MTAIAPIDTAALLAAAEHADRLEHGQSWAACTLPILAAGVRALIVALDQARTWLDDRRREVVRLNDVVERVDGRLTEMTAARDELVSIASNSVAFIRLAPHDKDEAVVADSYTKRVDILRAVGKGPS